MAALYIVHALRAGSRHLKAKASNLSDAAAQSQNKNQVRLADFIRLNLEEIIVEWVAFAKTLTPASDNMTKLALRDHIEEILNFIADDLETFQTEKERFAKSRGLGPDESPVSRSVAEIHASLRLIDGFNIDQMVSEYRALRARAVPWRIESVGVGDLGGV